MSDQTPLQPQVQYVPAQIQVKPYGLVTGIAVGCLIVGALFNPFAIPSILGIVFASISLYRRVIARAAGQPPHTALGIVLLVLAIAETIWTAYSTLNAVAAAGY